MSKRKILALASAVCMVAILAIGGTLAYFTSTDTETNTFTTGGVQIELVEQQRGLNKDGKMALVDFENDKVLMPIVGSAQGEQEVVGGVKLPTAKNYVDKIISIKNTGKSEAYVRVFVAVPTALQNGQTPNAPRYDVLHWNFNGDSCAKGQWTDEIVVANPTVINGIEYKIYSRTYTTALDADETTATPAYIGFYLDKSVDQEADGTWTVDFNDGNGRQKINFKLEDGVEIPVFAQAVQAAGFDSAEAAFAASGLPSNPWVNN